MSDVRIAKAEIFFDGARAHMPGDEVPAENVKAHGWEDLVVGPDTKTAAQLKSDSPS